MNTHSRRYLLLAEARPATVNLTASLAERIPAPTLVGPGHYKAPTVLRCLCADTHEDRLIHTPPLPLRILANGGGGFFAFAKQKLTHLHTVSWTK